MGRSDTLKGWHAVFRGAVSLSALEVLGMLLSLVTLPYLLHVLGPADFGRFAVGCSAAALLALVADYGFGQLGPREVVHTEIGSRERRELFWSVQLAKSVLALLALPVVAVVANLSSLQVEYGDVLFASFVGVLSSWMFPGWFLQGAQLYRTLALSQAAARLLMVGATLCLVRSGGDVALAVFLQALVGALAGTLALADGTYRSAIRPVRPLCRDAALLLRKAWPLFLSSAAVSSYTQAVPLLLGLTTSPGVVGLFSAADKLRAALQAVLAPVGVAAFPWFSRRIAQDATQGMKAARHFLLLQLGLALCAAFVVCVAAEPALRLLGGAAFDAAVPAARVLGLCIVCTAVSNTLGVQLMLPLRMERAFAAILVSSAAFGLVMLLLLAPALQQLGAAISVLLTEAAVALLMTLTLARRLRT